MGVRLATNAIFLTSIHLNVMLMTLASGARMMMAKLRFHKDAGLCQMPRNLEVSGSATTKQERRKHWQKNQEGELKKTMIDVLVISKVECVQLSLSLLSVCSS